MNKPIQLALAALALCAAQQCSAALPLSFPVARDWLYERSDKLKASEEQVQSKRETQKSLETLGGPTVTLQAMQIAGQKKIDIDKSIPNPLAGTLPIQLPGSFSVGLHEKMSLNGPRVAATATWPIYTGGKISAMQDASKYAVDEAVAQKRADSEDLDAQLAGYYFGTQLALSVEKLQKDMLHHQDRELAKAKKFEKQGMISKIERMSVQVQRDNRNREYLKAKDNAKVARLQLARLLRDEEFGKLTTPLFVLNRPLEPLKYWVDTALASNPQIAVIQAKAEILADEKKLLAVIRTEILEIADKYGDDRRTQIGYDEFDISMEDLIPETNTVITMTKVGYIKRMGTDNFKSQHRGFL